MEYVNGFVAIRDRKTLRPVSDFKTYTPRIPLSNSLGNLLRTDDCCEVDYSAGLNIQAFDCNSDPCMESMAFAKAMEVRDWTLFRKRQVFSPVFLHLQGAKFITTPVNATVLAETLKNIGICTEDDCPQTIRNANNVSAAAIKNATKNKVSQIRQVLTAQDVFSDLQLNGPCVISIRVGESFTRLSPINAVVLPEVTIGVMTLVAVGIVKIDGAYYVKALNCWGSNWGDKGFCYISQTNLVYHLVQGITVALKDLVVKSIPEVQTNNKPVVTQTKPEAVTTPAIENPVPVVEVVLPGESTVEDKPVTVIEPIADVLPEEPKEPESLWSSPELIVPKISEVQAPAKRPGRRKRKE